MIEDISDFFLHGILYIFLAITCVGILLVAVEIYDDIKEYSYQETCAKTQRVTAIGACDRYGRCGVMAGEGQVYQATKPVVGQRICLPRS